MKQQGELTLAKGEALLAAKSGGEKGRNGFGRESLEVSLPGGGRLRLEPLACGISALSATPPPWPCRGRAWAVSQGGSRQEQIGFSDRKRGMRNAQRNFD